MKELRDLLETAIPAAPPATGRGAEARGRARRARHLRMGAGAAAVVVAAAVAVPVWNHTRPTPGPADGGSSVCPTPKPSDPFSLVTTKPDRVRTGAIEVRFCSLNGAAEPPDSAVLHTNIDKLTRLVNFWPDSGASAPDEVVMKGFEGRKVICSPPQIGPDTSSAAARVWGMVFLYPDGRRQVIAGRGFCDRVVVGSEVKTDEMGRASGETIKLFYRLLAAQDGRELALPADASSPYKGGPGPNGRADMTGSWTVKGIMGARTLPNGPEDVARGGSPQGGHSEQLLRPEDAGTVHLTFADGRVEGDTGCETFTGSYTEDNGVLDIPPGDIQVSTTKNCKRPSPLLERLMTIAFAQRGLGDDSRLLSSVSSPFVLALERDAD